MANKDFAPLMSMIKTLKAHTNHSPMSEINTMKAQACSSNNKTFIDLRAC